MKYKFLAALLFLVTLHSCVLYPRYDRTIDGLPEYWREKNDPATTIANYNWWMQLGDPVLDALICEALEHNKDLRIAIARVYEFYAIFGAVRSFKLPTVSGIGGFQRQESSLEALGFDEPITGLKRISNIYDFFLNFSYELDFFGRIRSLTDAACYDYLSQVSARKTVILTLVASVAGAYIQLRQYDKQLQISKDTYKSRLDSYELAVLRFEGGLTSELEVKQAASEIDVALAQVKQLEIQIPQQENLISILVGKNPESIARGRVLDALIMPSSIPAGLPSDLLQQRPDLMQAEQQLLAANARIGVARAEFFPNINLTGIFGAVSLDLSKLFTGASRQWNIALDVMQPLFNAERLSYQLDAAEMRKMQALYQYQKTVQNAFREVNDALIAHQKSKELVEVYRHRVGVLKDYLELARLQYENGQTDYLNVLDAERNLFSGQLDYAQAEGTAFISFVTLYEALGGGWVEGADRETICCP